MPNIRTYDNPVNGLQPNDRGPQSAFFAARAQEDATRDVGRAVGGGIKDLGEGLAQEQNRREVSASLKEAATINNYAVIGWNETASQPGAADDPELAAKWLQDKEPEWQAWIDAAGTEGGKKFREQQVAGLRQHMFEKTAADMSRLGGISAVKNITDGMTIASNTVAADPSSLNSQIGLQKAAIDAYLEAHPGMDADDQAKVRTELGTKAEHDLTVSAFIGMANANPAEAVKAIDSGFGGTYLDASDRDTLRRKAEEIGRTKAADQRVGMAAQRQQAKDEADAFQTKLYLTGLRPDGSWQPQPGMAEALYKAAEQNPLGFSREDVSAFVAANEHAIDLQTSKKLQVDDPSTYERFAKNLAGNDQTAINQAFSDGHLSSDSRTFFLQAADDAKKAPGREQLNQSLNKFFEGTKSSVTKSNPYAMEVYPEMDQQWNGFQQMVMRTVNWAVTKQGMTPEEAAFTYLDPRGPKYLGSLIPKYQLSQTQLDEAADREDNVGVVAPVRPGGVSGRQPGETIDQYLKRTGG